MTELAVFIFSMVLLQRLEGGSSGKGRAHGLYMRSMVGFNYTLVYGNFTTNKFTSGNAGH